MPGFCVGHRCCFAPRVHQTLLRTDIGVRRRFTRDEVPIGLGRSSRFSGTPT
jgi:hypothetical protein